MFANGSLLQKADVTLATLAAGGLKNPGQFNFFVRTALEEAQILGDARTVTMNGPVTYIDKLAFGNRMMRPAVEKTPLAVADRYEPQTGRVVLNAFEVIAEMDISYSFFEDNIEGGNINANNPNGPSTVPVSGGVKATLLAMMAQKAIVELEELLIGGDTASGDAWLAQADGLLKLATSHVVDHGSAAIVRTMLNNGLVEMPDPYLRDRRNLRHYLSFDRELQYQESLGGRQTQWGDQRIIAADRVPGYGTPVVPVSLMPNTQGLLVNPQNILWGIHRDMSIEVDKDIRERCFVVVMTMRIAMEYQEEDAVVKYINVGT